MQWLEGLHLANALMVRSRSSSCIAVCRRVNDSSNVYSYGDSKLYAQMVSRVYAKQLEASGVHVFQGQPGQTSTNFFSATKFSWLKPGATGQYLTQALIGLKPEQGALPIIYSSIAPEQDLESESNNCCLFLTLYSLWISLHFQRSCTRLSKH